MLGRDHALSGAVGFIGLAPALSERFLHSSLSPVEIGVGGVVSAAFALLPDLDEPGSTVSRKLGPLSRGVSRVTRLLAGGHRKATHCLLFAAGIYLGMRVACHHPLSIAIIAGCSFLLVLRMLLPEDVGNVGLFGPFMLALAAASSWWVFTDAGVATWLPYAAAGGVLWHMVGDSLTVEGVPWLWLPLVGPLQDARVSIPLVGHCGSARETFLGWAMGIGVLYLSWIHVVAPIVHQHWPALRLPAG